MLRRVSRPTEIDQLERAHRMVQAELQRLVDVARRRDTLHQHVERLVADAGVDARGDEAGRLAHQHGLLPHPRATPPRSPRASPARVSSACTISISFILCTGLKKCMPATRDGFFSEPASSVMLSADVFEAMTARGRRQPLDLREQRQLEIDLLRRRLDDEVGVLRAPPRGSRSPSAAPAWRRRQRVGHLPELDALPDDLLDGAARPSPTASSRHVVHARVVAARDRRMRDPVPHRPRAEYRDRCLTSLRDTEPSRTARFDQSPQRRRSRDRSPPRCCRSAAPCGCRRRDGSRR